MTSAPDNPRRLRLRVLTKLCATIAALAVVAVALGYIGGGPAKPVAPLRRVALDDLAPGEARRLVWNGRPVIVLRRGRADWLVALASPAVTGCPVVWDAARERLIDPCSGARYDSAGRPIDAPGLKPLRQPPHHFDAAGRLVLGRN